MVASDTFYRLLKHHGLRVELQGTTYFQGRSRTRAGLRAPCRN